MESETRMSSLPVNGQYKIAADPAELIDLVAGMHRIWQNKLRLLSAGLVGVGLAWLWMIFLRLLCVKLPQVCIVVPR